MYILRFSIAGLMGVVLIVGVGFASLRSGSPIWASGMFTLTVALLSAAIVAGIAVRGRGRLACVGFAVFGWVYLAVAFGPWPHNLDGPPQLVTVPLLDAVQDYVFSDGKTTYMTVDHRSQDSRVSVYHWGVPTRQFLPLGGHKTVDLIAYRQIGHTLGAVLFGLVGALVGGFFAARNEATEMRRTAE